MFDGQGRFIWRRPFGSSANANSERTIGLLMGNVLAALDPADGRLVWHAYIPNRDFWHCEMAGHDGRFVGRLRPDGDPDPQAREEAPETRLRIGPRGVY